jgi:hypothetical protein
VPCKPERSASRESSSRLADLPEPPATGRRPGADRSDATSASPVEVNGANEEKIPLGPPPQFAHVRRCFARFRESDASPRKISK